VPSRRPKVDTPLYFFSMPARCWNDRDFALVKKRCGDGATRPL
jgi:hypothetical protein